MEVAYFVHDPYEIAIKGSKSAKFFINLRKCGKNCST